MGVLSEIHTSTCSRSARCIINSRLQFFSLVMFMYIAIEPLNFARFARTPALRTSSSASCCANQSSLQFRTHHVQISPRDMYNCKSSRRLMCTIDVSHALMTIPPVSHGESPGTRYLLAVTYAMVLAPREGPTWTLAASDCDPHHGAYGANR